MKYNLEDVTFTIPVRFDHKERFENLHFILTYLQKNFNTNIIVYEDGPAPLYDNRHHVQYIYEHNAGGLYPFHRSRYLNHMARFARTPFIVNYDCDVLFPIHQVIKTHSLLKMKAADLVYPYDGLFVSLPRHLMGSSLATHKPDSLNPHTFPNMGTQSVGGCCWWNKSAFIAGGLENEVFLDWGVDDVERMRRYSKLGFGILRVSGPLYHLDHPRSPAVNEQHQYFASNQRELAKVESMSSEQLREYIKTWKWNY